MITQKIGDKQVELYDSIDELPMSRFHKYNKYILVDAGIGSDLADFDSHIEKLAVYINSKTTDLANIELQNMRQNIYFIQTGISPKHLSFCVLVKSVDGIDYNDLSLDGLQKVLELFADVPHSEITDHLEAVKKKIDEQLQLYFPKAFDDASIKEYYDDLKKRTMLMLKSIIEGETDETQKEIDRITVLLITYNKPYLFSGTDNAEIQHDKNYHNMCLMISEYVKTDPKDFTVFEYYNAFEYVKEKLKPTKTGNKSK